VARLLIPVLTALLALGACGNSAPRDPVSVAAPQPGVCRMLTAHDVAQASNDSTPVACSEPHDAETFAVGSIPARFRTVDDPALDTWIYAACAKAFPRYLGTDDSTAMRSLLSWIWFRPTAAAWQAGAHWYRCDVLGGAATQSRYVDLPTTTKKLLGGRGNDQWMACVKGKSVSAGTTVPCTAKHDWRAVTTIKLGEPDQKYPGDAAVKAKTKSYCSDSVDAWLGYPADFDFGYTWFGQREWSAGNRRSVCWARTAR
jgi:hypothetical protein